MNVVSRTGSIETERIGGVDGIVERVRIAVQGARVLVDAAEAISCQESTGARVVIARAQVVQPSGGVELLAGEQSRVRRRAGVCLKVAKRPVRVGVSYRAARVGEQADRP